MKRKSTKKTISKLCSYLLTVALTVGGLTLSPMTTVEVQAAATTKNVNLRLDGDNSIAGISGATVNKANAATVYYGKYPDSTVGTVDTPIPWRVIGYGGNGVASSSGTATLLAADNVITGVEFESSGSSNNYDNSNLQSKIEEISAKLTSTETSGVVSRTLTTCNEIGEDHSKHNCDGITGKEVTDAAMWPLSTSEAKIVDNNLQKASEWWWLRSPGTYANCAAVVYDSGVVSSGGDGVNHGDGAARPAFNLDLSKVLFSTDSGENKSSVLVATSDRSATAWTLTLKDESGTFQYERTDKLTSYKTGEIVKINVTEISSQYDHITAMVLDNNNTSFLHINNTF